MALTGLEPPSAPPAPARRSRGPKKASTSDEVLIAPTRSRWPLRSRARTGSGATRSADNIAWHHLANLALVIGVAAGGVGSIDGLLAAAEIAFKPEMHWVLPAAVDVFLIGAAIATLALRERRAWPAVAFCVLVTLGLVGFSAVVNFTYWQSVTEAGTLAREVGPFIKGSMPILLLVALEILAAINTTKRKTTPASVVRLVGELAKLKGESKVRAKIAKVKDRDADRKAKRESARTPREAPRS